MSTQNQIKVWDPALRLFHWSLVLAFTVAYLTEEDLLDVHVVAGYTVLGLVVFRLLWGFIGTPHARFRDFVFRPRVIGAYLKDLLYFRAKRYLGHNPVGGAMIVILLASLLITTLTGLGVYGAEEHAGPLAAWFVGTGESWEDAFEETHEFFANFTLFLVFLHVTGVVIESFIHRENLTRAMVTGRKRA